MIASMAIFLSVAIIFGGLTGSLWTAIVLGLGGMILFDLMRAIFSSAFRGP